MPRNRLLSPTLLAGLFFGASFAFDITESGAIYERIAGIRCVRQDEHGYTYLSQSYGSWLENNSNVAQFYACPMLSTSDLPLDNVVTVEVDVYDGSTSDSVLVRACSYIAQSGFMACEPLDETGVAGTGADRLEPPLATLFDTGDTFYVRAKLPALGVSVSRISSIYVSN